MDSSYDFIILLPLLRHLTSLSLFFHQKNETNNVAAGLGRLSEIRLEKHLAQCLVKKEVLHKLY